MSASIKKIPVAQLRLGMFVHEFCGSWMDHPFWRPRLLLDAPEGLAELRASGIAEVWIDTARGLDVEPGAAQARAQAESELAFAATRPMQYLDEAPADQQEAALAEAAALCRRAGDRIATIFEAARLGRAVDARRCRGLVAEIHDSVQRNPGALVSVVRLKRADEYTYMHSVAVCALMIALGRQLGLKEPLLRDVGLAGLLHDVGKALVPSDILNKPGKLSDEQFAVMKSHPERGHALLLRGAGAAGAMALDVCLHHHEKVDGSGYPHRLQRETISVFARMGAVCDVYDAVTSDRPYKAGWDPGEALRRMAQWKGHLDQSIFHAFVKAVGIYPVGALVRLQSQRLAVVCAQNPQSLLAPRVKAFHCTLQGRAIEPQEIDLSQRDAGDKIIGCEPPEAWHFGPLEGLWGGVAP